MRVGCKDELKLGGPPSLAEQKRCGQSQKDKQDEIPSHARDVNRITLIFCDSPRRKLRRPYALAQRDEENRAFPGGMRGEEVCDTVIEEC